MSPPACWRWGHPAAWPVALGRPLAPFAPASRTGLLGPCCLRVRTPRAPVGAEGPGEARVPVRLRAAERGRGAGAAALHPPAGRALGLRRRQGGPCGAHGAAPAGPAWVG